MNIGNQQNKVKWAILAVFQNPQKKLVPSKYYLYEGQNSIGCDQSKADVVIDAEGVSPLHAEVYITSEGDAFITDLNSKQGIFKKASLSPNKKVKLEQNCRYSIIPDHEFYIGKYKCFIVAFDDDYKKGEERRQKEREEILQSQSQSNYFQNLYQNANNLSKYYKENVNLTIELDETDYDEAENNDIFGNRANQVNLKDQRMINEVFFKEYKAAFYLNYLFTIQKENNKKKEVSDLYEKTLELSDRDEKEEEDNQLFKAGKKSKQTEEYEKTLEIKSDGGDQEDNDLFGAANNNKNQQGSEYDKTLELSSDEGKEEGERNLFAQSKSKGNNNQNSGDYEKTLELSDRNSDEDNNNLFTENNNKQKKKNNREMECEKTLELSDVSDNDQDEVFNTHKSSKNKPNNNDQYEKTLELSDRNSDEENNNIFASSNNKSPKQKNNQQQQQYDKTLELSDRDSSENEKDQLFNTQNKKGKDMKMECEKTLELSDKDDNEDSNLFQTTQPATAPISASQNAMQKRMEILKNRKNQVSASLPVQQLSSSNKKMVDENKQQSNQRMIDENEQKNNKKMVDENDKTPDLSEEENKQKFNKQELVRRRDNDIKKALSPQPKTMNNQMLQETLVDEDSQNDDGWFDNNDNQNTQDKNKNVVQKNNQGNNLAATLIDSPQSQSLSQHNAKVNKRASPLSPTLVDDDTNSVKSLNQSTNSQNKVKKLKSPISLSPTFLDEEVNLNLLSVQSQQVRKLSQQSNQSRGNSNQELGATLIDPSDSKSRSLSPTLINSPESSQKGNPGILQNTIIDSPQSQHSQGYQNEENQMNTELMKKITQQEDELKRLKEQLQQNKPQSQQNSNIKQSHKEQEIKSSYQKLNRHSDQRQKQEDENYVINVLPSLSEMQSGEQTKKAKNINLDKVNHFDDLFGNDEEEVKVNNSRQGFNKEEKSKSGNENSSKNEDSNSGTENSRSQNMSNKIDSSQNQNPQQRNFGMLFNKKFPMRTLTMSDMKKQSISPISSATQPVSIDESDGKSTGKQQVSNTLPQKTLFQSSDASSDEQSNKRSSMLNRIKKPNEMKEENEPSNQESEDIGEDPKKKLKVQSSWVQLLKQRTGKMQDENSRNSTKSEDSTNKEQNSQPKQRNTRQSQEKGMVAEDADGYVIKDSLKIAVSGFKLNPNSKKGIKSLKSSLIENNDDFDILVVNETKRTIKLLLALMKMKPIVSEQWLNDSIKQNKLLFNFNNFQPEGETFKERFKQDLNHFVQKRKQAGQENPIFENYTFYISKSLSDPNDEELGSLIEAGGGQIRKTLPNKQMKKDTNMMVILGQNDLYIYKTVSKLKSVTCITSESILSSALNSQFETDNFLIESNDFFKE